MQIRKEVKEVSERYGINISAVVEEYLEGLAWKVKVKETLDKLGKLLKKVPSALRGYAVKSVRKKSRRSLISRSW